MLIFYFDFEVSFFFQPQYFHCKFQYAASPVFTCVTVWQFYFKLFMFINCRIMTSWDRMSRLSWRSIISIKLYAHIEIKLRK
jgi:hypothetical protein